MVVEPRLRTDFWGGDDQGKRKDWMVDGKVGLGTWILGNTGTKTRSLRLKD